MQELLATESPELRALPRRQLALGGRVPVAMLAACPFPANRGTPIRIRQMGEALHALGYDVHVITYHLGQELSLPGMTIHRTAPLKGYAELGAGPTWTKLMVLDPRLIRRTMEVVRRHNIRIVHAHHFEGALCALAARALSGRFKIIYDAHTTLRDELMSYRGFKGPRILKKLACDVLDGGLPRWCDHVVTVSERLRQSILRDGVAADRISVIPMAINREEFEPVDQAAARRRIGIEGRQLLVYAGNLAPFQGVDQLLRAWRMVAPTLPEARLLIVGRSSDEYVQMVQRLGLENHVIFTGEKPFPEVRLHIAAADAVVLPRDNCVGFPLKLLNYMAAGKPIVAFEGGGADVLRHLDNAWVVPNEHEEAFAAGILGCLTHPVIPGQIAAGARRDAERYGAESMARRVHELYRELLLPGPAPGDSALR